VVRSGPHETGLGRGRLVATDMSLEDLEAEIERTYADLEDHEFALDEESRRELTMLLACLDTDDADDLVRRAVHLLFQTTVDSGKLDFHLRSTHDVTYDEYLAGVTYDDMGGGFPQDDDDRRYQF